MVWKNSIAVFHTLGEPPSVGRTILVNIGCTEKTSTALRKIVAMNNGNTPPPSDDAAGGNAPGFAAPISGTPAYLGGVAQFSWLSVIRYRQEDRLFYPILIIRDRTN